MAKAVMELEVRGDWCMRIMLDDGAYPPLRAHATDAGLDLRTPHKVTIPSHGSATINTGVHIALPEGYYGKLESKSGLNVKNDVVCMGGTIDESYRGSIVAKLYNLSEKDYTFEPGDKVVQLVIQPYIAPALILVNELDETDRGSNGFGSSGR